MSCDQQSDGTVLYRSKRTERGETCARFEASYRPVSEPYTAADGSLEQWLTARYCLYAADRRRHLYRGEIDHVSWPLQRAVAEVQENTMLTACGVAQPEEQPLLHYADRLDVRIWGLERL